MRGSGSYSTSTVWGREVFGSGETGSLEIAKLFRRPPGAGLRWSLWWAPGLIAAGSCPITHSRSWHRIFGPLNVNLSTLTLAVAWITYGEHSHNRPSACNGVSST
jgi:hypothetical protein